MVGLSHELRSPLNAISGYAQLLEQDANLPSKPRDQVRVMRRSADHLSGLIDGILDISKIEAGRLYLSRDEVRLSEFLDQLVGMFRLQAAAKNIEFVFQRRGNLPPVVYTDEKRLRQILINLLSNAIKLRRAAACALSCTTAAPWRSSRSLILARVSSRMTSNDILRRSSVVRWAKPNLTLERDLD